MKRSSFAAIANQSLWETIRRSLATTFITLLPVASLLIFGGDTLKDFAFAIFVGVASGAYSTIFIATPLLVVIKEREPEYEKRKDAGLVEKLDEDDLCHDASEPEPGPRTKRRARAGSPSARRSSCRRSGGRRRPARSAQQAPPRPRPWQALRSPKGARDVAGDLLYAGLGAVALTKERVEELIEALTQPGAHVPGGGARDGRRPDGPLARRGVPGRTRRYGAPGILQELGLVTRREWEDLELRLAQVEHRLRLVEGEPELPLERLGIASHTQRPVRKLRLPSPALVVACLALLITLSGVGYAAKALPRNSVGTAQLKANAVNGSKVANNSLKGADIDEASLSGLAFVKAFMGAGELYARPAHGNRLDGLGDADRGAHEARAALRARADVADDPMRHDSVRGDVLRHGGRHAASEHARSRVQGAPFASFDKGETTTMGLTGVLPAGSHTLKLVHAVGGWARAGHRRGQPRSLRRRHRLSASAVHFPA